MILLTAVSSTASANEDSQGSIFSFFEINQTAETALPYEMGSQNAISDIDEANGLLSPDFLSDTKQHTMAKIRIIDTSFGRQFSVDTQINIATTFKNIKINVIKCLEETKVSLTPIHKALINIENTHNQEQIFYGWIFSHYRAVAQPNYKNYFIALNQCISEK